MDILNALFLCLGSQETDKRELNLPFVPIKINAYVALHLQHNPDEDRNALTATLREALAAQQAGSTCDCGNPIWVIGSAVAGHACFTCVTGEAFPEGDYEITGAC